jgi:uncharacterized repeat protein (TIGR01451 family)
MAEYPNQSRIEIWVQKKKKGVSCMNGIRGQKIFVMFLVLAGLFFFSAGVSRAQSEARLDLKTTAEKEIKVQRNGKLVTERTPLGQTNPRDVLVYAITYANSGKEPVVDPAIVDPIPSGTVYILDSAEGQDAEITCSIDGGRSFQKPPIWMKFKNPNGTVESKPAPADRYTHIRWTIKKPVLPGQSGRVSLKVTVK